jgi:hypothetical protein
MAPIDLQRGFRRAICHGAALRGRALSSLLFLSIACFQTEAGTLAPDRPLILCASADNDLYRVLLASGLKCRRFSNAEESVKSAPDGAGVLLLADGYPERKTELPDSLLAQADARRLRLYVEFPASLPGMEVGQSRGFEWGRVVVSSDFFGPELQRLRILDLHECKFLPVTASSPDIIIGRVAGYDTASFGLPDPAFPILFAHPRGNLLVATTKLSQFVTARYAPTDAWTPIWRKILTWLDPGLADCKLIWTPTVRPAYGRNEDMPADSERRALERGLEWFRQARLLVAPWQLAGITKRQEQGYTPAPAPGDAAGDGSLGIGEGYAARIMPDGSQLQTTSRRGDCTGECAMAFAFGGKLLGLKEDDEIARKLLDYWYFASEARKGAHADPKSPAYGLISWTTDSDEGRKSNYGDDNARLLFGTMAASALLGENKWDEAMLQDLLGLLRTSGRLGFRAHNLRLDALLAHGWRHYFNERTTDFAPHYESYLWAGFLWAYQKTGFELFRQRAETAIGLTMQAYPDGWRWANGIQQERARMLLPLAWLVRVSDTPEHRGWLRRITMDVLSAQDESGAIREEIGPLERGNARPPQSNAQYGTTEAPLLQKNGDPVCDMLYTCNFAFLGLHEAAAATGDPLYAQASDKLARFFSRIQIKSQEHPELDGGWYRAFDFQRWEYWASSSDLGWGAWSIEDGWTQGWICAVLALRQMNTSLWSLTAGSRVAEQMAALRPMMIPDDALKDALMDDKSTISNTSRANP